MNLKDKMDLLGIQDVTTNRQHRNGTVVWRLPIKNNNSGKTFIEVASFSTGYVRNQNSGYSNYQLNKRCESEPQYYPEYDRNGKKTGKYVQFTTRTCKLIPNEKDRLEYLIAYCLKNYYIKHANQVAEGKYVTKWYHEWELSRLKDKNSDELDSDFAYNADIIHELESSNYKFSQKIKDLEEKLDEANNQIKKLHDFIEASKTFSDSMYEGRNDEVKNLENKLATIERIANDRNKWNG